MEKFAMKWFNIFKRFFSCFVIEKVNDGNRNSVLATLSVNTSFEHKLDYEIFETVYLTIVVEDVDQTIMPNSASAILVIRIEDENDNAPEFVGDTLTVYRRVFEEADEGVLIGSILARDIDGPGNNIISYTMT